jgi:ketosteroid isomerase-like protein
VTADRAAEQQVRHAAELRARALAAGDEDALRLLMHPDLKWTTHRGDVLSYDSYIDGNIHGDIRWHSQRLDDVRVAVVGDAAVLTALVTDEVHKDGRDQTLTLRLTQTWIRTEGAWRCLAGHASTSS